jgi:uncharacterized linocin/CFP29 family protein
VVAVPRYLLQSKTVAGGGRAPDRLEVDSDPDLPLTTIAVNVQLRTADAADPDLRAALVMFRRAANIVARIEDALVFRGRPAPPNPAGPTPPPGLTVPNVYDLSENKAAVQGLLAAPGQTAVVPQPAPQPPLSPGQLIFKAIVAAIAKLEGRGQLGPFAAVLDDRLFEDACDPTGALVLPRDRILPFLQGPLLRSSTLNNAINNHPTGLVVALAGEPVELVVASDISVRYLQSTLEPRFVFRVSERVALRIKDPAAIEKLA